MPSNSYRQLKKWLAWSFWAANLVAIVAFWASGSGQLLFGVSSGDSILAIARLVGLLATFGMLTQFMLMGRAGWLEPIFGLDRLAIFHGLNGKVTVGLMLVHGPLVATAYSLITQTPLLDQTQAILQYMPFTPLAAVAETLFVIMVATSITMTRRHLKFEWWYYIHLIGYIGLGLIVWHQLANGFDLNANPAFRVYWVSLYLFVVAHLLVWRFGLPFWKYYRHQFVVEKVVQETPTAASVYIKGRNFQHYRMKAGQFVLVRFFAKGFWGQEHPFSLSMLPSDGRIRLTIRQLGDFTNAIPSLPPGTKVLVSGPYGAFTHQKQQRDKVVYIAGGIGITPLRAMIEERAAAGLKDTAILLYGNRTVKDTALLGELKTFGERIAMPVHNVLSQEPTYAGEKGYVDKEKIARLVPDVAERDVFLCGPPPMMAGVITALHELGVPPGQIHYERFALHKDPKK